MSGMSETCPSLCVERSHPGREHDEAEDGCYCWTLCSMGPTCPGANAGLDRGCWRTEDIAMCACGHGLHVHDAEADPYLCEVCGDNTRCDYASREEIAADRWDEGWHAAVIALCPYPTGDPQRLLWCVMDHPPKDNPYRVPAEPHARIADTAEQEEA